MSSRPRSLSADIAAIAVFAALIAVLGLPGGIYVSGVGAPIVLQNLGIILAGAILGWRRGTLAVVVFFLLVLIGLPLFPGLPGGPAAFVTPRIGFQLSYLLIPGLIGVLTQMMLPRYRILFGIGIHLLVGIVFCYAMGIGGLMVRGGLGFVKALMSMGWYIIFDIVKCALAAVLAYGLHKALPGFTPPLHPGKAVDPLAEPSDPVPTASA